MTTGHKGFGPVPLPRAARVRPSVGGSWSWTERRVLVICLVSSALVTLARIEAESAALREGIQRQAPTTLGSSSLAEAEVVRALRGYKSEAEGWDGVPAVMTQVYRIAMDPRIRALAVSWDMVGRRTRDAIHLATAESLQSDSHQRGCMIVYDVRLSAAAEARGLATAHPGLECGSSG